MELSYLGVLLLAVVTVQGDFNTEDQLLLEVLQPGWEQDWEDYLQLQGDNSLPDIGQVQDIRFILWTRSNRDEPHLFNAFNKSSVDSSPLDTSLYTYIFFHGYNDNGMTDWIQKSKDELLTKFDCNVISVDYEMVVPSPYYVQSVLNAYKTANLTASVLDWLAADYGLQPQRVHMIGHSLGAHTAGMTGLWVQADRVDRVTGSDPAGPLFYSQNESLTISPNSADFVDIIHSNGCFLLKGCYGMARSLGHVDFYPNGGVHQPGCVKQNNTIGEIMDMIHDCSHHRSVELWIESIVAEEPNVFWSWPCKDWEMFDEGLCTSCGAQCLQMGLPAQKGFPGRYYLSTAAVSPYAKGGATSLLPLQSRSALTLLIVSYLSFNQATV